MQSGDTLSGLSAQERAEIEALLTRDDAAPEDVGPAQRIGPFRWVIRMALRIASLAVLGVVGWHIYALAGLPEKPFDAIHAPLALTIGSGLVAILLLLWFDGKPRRLLLALFGLLALTACLLSMRWADSSRHGVREYWAGIERGSTTLSGDLCYRIDAAVFELRGAGRARFVYRRGIWPGAFDEAAFKRYFFSDLRMRSGADGWTCIDRR